MRERLNWSKRRSNERARIKPIQSEYEQRGLFGTSDRLKAASMHILPNLGWDKLDVCALGVTAQMNETDEC